MSEAAAAAGELDREDFATAAYAECMRLARAHYENFTVGSWLLPRELRHDLAAIYAFARGGDDLADEGPDEGRVARLAEWEAQLLACAEDPTAVVRPVFIALGQTIRRRELPLESLRDLLVAFRRDAAGETRRFASFGDLLDYCRYSANPVGRLVLALFGYHDAERIARADQICTALQLTNFWQDIASDLDRDRVYLPSEDLERFPGSRDALASRRLTPGFRDLLAFETRRTRELFRAGLGLAETVNSRLAREIRLFVGGGLALIERIERANYDVFTRRPTLGRGALARLVLREVWR